MSIAKPVLAFAAASCVLLQGCAGLSVSDVLGAVADVGQAYLDTQNQTTPQQSQTRYQSQTSSTSQGMSRCGWMDVTSVIQKTKLSRGTRCGTPDSLDVELRNNANGRIKTLIYIQEFNGRWIKNADGTFDDGIPMGGTVGAYSCHSTGNYYIVSVPQSEFVAKHCGYPEYDQW